KNKQTHTHKTIHCIKKAKNTKKKITRYNVFTKAYTLMPPPYSQTNDYFTCRGGLTIWKLGHCPRARGQ
ncbi:unnamed protein product, partial [Staurois parvus]